MLKLKPHHIIDIIRDYGQYSTFEPHIYGHAYHTVAKNIIENIEQEVQLVITSDDVCIPCMNLSSEKQCRDILPNHPYSSSKQIYNDYLDAEILKALSINAEFVISIKGYLLLVFKEENLFYKIYPHSKDIIEQRKIMFRKGLNKLGFSEV